MKAGCGGRETVPSLIPTLGKDQAARFLGGKPRPARSRHDPGEAAWPTGGEGRVSPWRGSQPAGGKVRTAPRGPWLWVSRVSMLLTVWSLKPVGVQGPCDACASQSSSGLTPKGQSWASLLPGGLP